MIALIEQMVTKSIAWMLVGTFFILNPAFGENSKESIFDIMNYTEVLELTLEADLTDLTTNRRTEEYQVGYVRFSDNKKMEQAWKIKVRPRGKYRRRVCEMPPLKLKFKKSELAMAGLSEFNDLKLVTHCSDNKQESKNWLMKEYLAYKLYNELTENSFRVQLVKITYVDILTGKKSKNWGFLIEDKDQLADRMNAEKCDCNGMDLATLDADAEQLMTVFQYMIGNEDWNLRMVRNLKMFKKEGKIIPVPYDFDFAGIVNAKYAIPNVSYGMKRITDRAYFGTSQVDEDLTETMKYFQSKRKALITVVKNFREINYEERATVSSYLQSFYKNPEEMVKVEKAYQKAGSTKTSGNTAK